MNKEEKQKKIPVVVVMGHVDHGKSSILEAIRDFKITAKESGGITQHIGAYEVEHEGKKITFIDTPGHEAFSAMRARGAKAADIAILVVAADEGPKPQTLEAFSQAKENKLPVIVAINKMDKPEANSERVKIDLSKKGIILEKMGGDIPFVEVSAKSKEGIPQLLEMIILVSEMEEYAQDDNVSAEGLVIESYLDSNKGPIATLLVRKGIIKKGDTISTTTAICKIKNMLDFQGKQMDEAGPSKPVSVLGFEKTPAVGEIFKIGAQEKNENAAEFSIPFFSMEEGKPVLKIIIKVDVVGSLEPIAEILKNLPKEQVGLQILKMEPGDVNDSDIKTAHAGGAKIIGFRVKAKPQIEEIARREKVKILLFDIIYDLAQAARAEMEKKIELQIIRKDLGKLKVLAIFLSEKNRQIIGGRIFDGEMRKNAKLEVFRNEEYIGKGKIAALQHNKKETGVVVKGKECGISFEGDVKIQEGDELAAYIEEQE